MWYPMNRANAVTSTKAYTDEEMRNFLANGMDNGWTLEKDSEEIVSAFKNGRYIRSYQHMDN